MSEKTRPVEPEPDHSNGHGELPPEELSGLADEDSPDEFIPDHGPNFPGTTDPDKQ